MRYGRIAMGLKTALFLCVPAFTLPEISWIYLSSGISLDHWRGSGANGDGLAWQAKDNSLNTPHTLRSFNAGGAMRFPGLASDFGVSLHARYFANSLQAFTTRDGYPSQADHAQGFGDVDLEGFYKWSASRSGMKNTLMAGLRIPGPYEPSINIWSGFGVYRMLLGYAFTLGNSRVHFRSDWVLPLRLDESVVLVRAGDFEAAGGYRFTHRLSRTLKVKPGIDFGYARYRWKGFAAQSEMSADPVASLSWNFLPSRELSFSSAITAYSREDGYGAAYGSRRVSAGIYLGWYF